MSTILIIESNSPELLAEGFACAASFVRSLTEVAPSTQLRIAAPYSAPLAKDAFDDVDGVIFTGSAVDWSADAPEAAPLRNTMETAFGTGLPSWGSCNGLQLAGVVLGGSVCWSPNGKEIGLSRDVQLTDDGATHPMMAGRINGFAVPCVHRDEVQRVPDGAVVLAGNAHTAVQAMVYEKDGIDFWGTQYHPELTTSDVAQEVRDDRLFQHVKDENIVKNRSGFADDLEQAAVDEVAARRVGTSVASQKLEVRARDFINWLNHLREKSTARHS